MRPQRQAVDPPQASIDAPRADSVRASATDANSRILLVSPQPFYEDRGTPISVLYTLRALSELGYSIDLLTYPIGTTPDIPNVRYYRVGNPLRFKFVPVSFSWRKLFLDVLLLFRLIRMLRRGRYLYVHAVEEAALFTAALRRLHRTPIVYDMASSMPEQLAIKPYFQPRPILALTRRIERWLLERVDLVVASAGLRETALANVRVPVLDWQFPAEAPDVPPERVAALRAELGLPADAKTVVYTGTFAAYQGIEQLIESIRGVRAAHPATCFVLVGAKDEAEVRQSTARLDPEDRAYTRILARQPKDRIPDFHQLADILVSPRLTGANLPLKVFDYLIAERPIVATDIPSHRALLNDEIAVIVAPTAAGFTEGINTILSEPELGTRLARAGKLFAEDKLSWQRFVAFIGDMALRVSSAANEADQVVS